MDYHSTMLSESPDDATRWGTSIQLTKRGVNAIGRYWENAKTSRAITPTDFLKRFAAKKKVFKVPHSHLRIIYLILLQGFRFETPKDVVNGTNLNIMAISEVHRLRVHRLRINMYSKENI